jgi:two-component system cell cycle response regulator
MTRILIVDDSRFEAEEIRSILEKDGFEVVWADTGASGMKTARTLLPDLVLLDLILPDISGHEVCRWLRNHEETSNIPVIIVTSRERTEEKVLGLEEGASDYITKPFEPTELRARVEASIRMKRLQDQLIRKNSEYEDLLKKVQQLAVTDPVTGLFNRRYFQEALEQEFSRFQRYSTPFSCLMLDIDHFKQVNDTFGHEAGDHVLRELGKTIQLQLRQMDLLARYGGDELAVLLPESSREDARRAAQRILEGMRNKVFPGLGESHRVTLSIGVSGHPDPGLREANQAVLTADFALYRAKREGRNRVEVATFKETDAEPR